jgi:hypothetical protein|eukprot:COSAG01_NODE_5541_length_4196_cov_18.251892_4_plen_95_part_00
MSKTTDSTLFKVANILFPIMFFLVRLCMGIPFSYTWGVKLYYFLQQDLPAVVVAKSYVLYVAVRICSVPFSLRTLRMAYTIVTSNSNDGDVVSV